MSSYNVWIPSPPLEPHTTSRILEAWPKAQNSKSLPFLNYEAAECKRLLMSFFDPSQLFNEALGGIQAYLNREDATQYLKTHPELKDSHYILGLCSVTPTPLCLPEKTSAQEVLLERSQSSGLLFKGNPRIQIIQIEAVKARDINPTLLYQALRSKDTSFPPELGR